MKPYGAQPQKASNTYAIISIILGLAPFIIALLAFVIFFLVTSGIILGDVGQALWPLFMLLPVAILVISLLGNVLAVIFGIIAIMKQNAFISWIGIMIVALKAIPLLIIVI